MQILKTLVVALLVAGVIPLLLGLLFELVIVAPLRVPLDQTPLFYPWQVCCWSRFVFALIVMHFPALWQLPQPLYVRAVLLYICRDSEYNMEPFSDFQKL